jgi:hypothetical protein
MAAFRRDAVDDAGGERFLGGEEVAASTVFSYKDGVSI